MIRSEILISEFQDKTVFFLKKRALQMSYISKTFIQTPKVGLAASFHNVSLRLCTGGLITGSIAPDRLLGTPHHSPGSRPSDEDVPLVIPIDSAQKPLPGKAKRSSSPSTRAMASNTAFVPSTTFLPNSRTRVLSPRISLPRHGALPRASLSPPARRSAPRPVLHAARTSLVALTAVAATFLPFASARRDVRAAPQPRLSTLSVPAVRAAPAARLRVFATAPTPAPEVDVAAQRPALASAAAAHQSSSFSVRARAHYALSEFLCWNPAARVLMLLAFGGVVVGVGATLFRKFDPEGKETNNSPFWMACRAYLNPLEDDWGTKPLRFLSVGIAAFGLTFFSIFVGMITEAVESGIAAADSGYAQVVAKKHTVICGWNYNTPQIIANINSLAGQTKIVVLVAESERAAMMDEMRDALSEEQQKRVSISVRSGTPILPHDLEKVAASRAGKIILSAGRGVSAQESDRRILARALALRANVPLFSGDVVAELSSERDEKILQSIFRDTNARDVSAVSAEKLLFRFMAQAVRTPSLADVVGEMLGYNKKTVFHVVPATSAAPYVVGMNYKDLRPTSIPGSIIVGYKSPETNGKVVLSAPGSKDTYAVTASTDLLLLGLPSGRLTGKEQSLPASGATGSEKRLPSDSRRSSAENILVCGWRPDTMKDFLSELDVVLPRGSNVTVIDGDAPDVGKTSTLSMNFRHIGLSTVTKAITYDTLQDLLSPRQKNFDRVLVLSSAMGKDGDKEGYSGVEEDSKALTTLCYINDLLKQRKDMGLGTTVTVEFLNERIADVARADASNANVILPQSLAANIAAQTVRDHRLNSVWDEILSQAGKEIYLKPVAGYIKSPLGLGSFESIASAAASQRDEIVIGYITSRGERVINPSGPDRFEARTWSMHDQIITLAD